jgi:hypothetical protein
VAPVKPRTPERQCHYRFRGVSLSNPRMLQVIRPSTIRSLFYLDDLILVSCSPVRLPPWYVPALYSASHRVPLTEMHRSMLLLSLDDDILIYIVSFLLPLDVLQVRKTNKRLFYLSHLRIVWANICKFHILFNGYPFPSQPPLDLMSDAQLEQHTLHASSLASRWKSSLIHAPRRDLFIDATSTTSVYQVRFVPGHAGDWILTASKAVWDILTLWTVAFREGEESTNNGHFEKLCDWSPRGGIFNGLCLNTDATAKATLAISVLKDEFVA